MSGLVNQTTTYSVNMVPYSKEAIDKLKAECLFRETVSKKRLLNIAAAFDTETSSFIDEQTYEKSAYCYIWMFGIEDTVVYGRYLDEFTEMIHELNKFLELQNSKLVVYVHFLKFDFSFIKGYLEWDNVFIKKNRDVLFANYGNIEFRDSLVLAGGNGLAKVGKSLRRPVQKAVGDLDYELVRNSKTPLSQTELHYCEMDVRVLIEYIREKIEDDGDISKIPYTNTGYVRRTVREACFENRRAYSQIIDGLTMTPRCAEQAMDAFAGGSVFGNLKYIGKTVKRIQSYDIKSSYPYVMCCCYFPINYFTPVSLVNQTKPYSCNEISPYERYLHEYCCMFELELWDVEPSVDFYFPISKHKCHEIIAPVSSGQYQESASGRIISAMYLSITCTELDFDTIRRFYKFSKYRITDIRISQRGYLPKPIVKSIAKFFNGKTTLDGVKGMEREYMVSKNMLNSIYGMMVEKVIRDNFSFDNVNGFTKEKADIVNAVIEWNEKRNRFLFYPWGVWVTAHARYRLHDAIWAIGKDFRYCDTDSVKFIGNHDDYFSLVNQTAEQSVLACAQRNGIDIDFMIPKSPDGDRKVLGVWEKEWSGADFKTLGAKRYLIHFTRERDIRKHGEWELTVAGTNKRGTLDYIQKEAKRLKTSPFKVFTSNLVVPSEYAKRTVSSFFDDEKRGWITDYLGNRDYYVSRSGINVSPATYSFSITDEMRDAVIWLTHDAYYQDGEV